jgi:hypothetical protein
MGVFAAVNDLGGAVGPLVAYALAATVGLAAAYGLSCLLMLAALAVAAFRAATARPAHA